MSQQKNNKEIRLHEGELNVMELLWSNKVLAAKDIAKIKPDLEADPAMTTDQYLSSGLKLLMKK